MIKYLITLITTALLAAPLWTEDEIKLNWRDVKKVECESITAVFRAIDLYNIEDEIIEETARIGKLDSVDEIKLLVFMDTALNLTKARKFIAEWIKDNSSVERISPALCDRFIFVIYCKWKKGMPLLAYTLQMPEDLLTQIFPDEQKNGPAPMSERDAPVETLGE